MGKESRINRIMIAAPASGSGKTLVTCGLLQLLRQRGADVTAFKCGPDYIDPMFHDRVLGVGGGNLDTFFCSAERTAEILAGCGHSHAVLEGVMGVYDGLGGLELQASSYDVALATRTPILLVVNAKGTGRTLIPQLCGILKADPEHLIKGILLNRVSEGFYRRLAAAVNESLSEECYAARVLGYLPDLKKAELDSRHLGLLRPEEIPELAEKVRTVAATLEQSMDLQAVLRIMEAAEPLKCGEQGESGGSGMESTDSGEAQGESGCSGTESADIVEGQSAKKAAGKRVVRLAVARDEAFCFYYRENLRLLERMGTVIVPFSPIRDRHLPEDIDGLYIGGGYPELYLPELAANTSMREEIRQAIAAGIPSIAECGGFMYLHDTIEDADGNVYPMVGAVHGNCSRTGGLRRFGYIELQSSDSGGLREALNGLRGHEFHYYDSTDCGEDMKAVKAGDDREWKTMHVGEEHVWGFPHLFMESHPEFAEHFTEVMRHGRKKYAG